MPYRDPVKQKAAKQRHRNKRRQQLRDAKSGGCIDCGEKDVVVLGFHHRDPAAKLFNVSQNRSVRYALLEAEIAKCDILCANCHLRRHHGTSA